MARGKGLLTFQGMSSAGADQGALHLALKQLSDSTSTLARALLSSNTVNAVVPLVVDLHGIVKQGGAKLQQMELCGMTHAVMAEVAHHVFGAFRTTNLIINSSSSSFGKPPDEDALLLQLMLEEKNARGWLQLVNADRRSEQEQAFGAQIVGEHARTVLHGLLHSEGLQWGGDAQTNQHMLEQLLPAAKEVAAAAIKAQVICSCMHTRLVQLHVPGWRQPGPGNVDFGDAAPSAWASWPGVVPWHIGSACMQLGGVLPTAAGVLPSGVTAAAVFCMEPAVIHVAERMKQLQLAAQKPDGCRTQPFRVIRKAKMWVAQPTKW
ncbi:hypothetical protein OEZ86_008785 [Tetradesmus obliquus]|nr:hypothetical protein OEZ86_008785 [Tetradesmus obliquus]